MYRNGKEIQGCLVVSSVKGRRLKTGNSIISFCAKIEIVRTRFVKKKNARANI